MNNHLIVDEVRDDFKIKEIGYGAHAICYLTSDERAYKEFRNVAPNYHMMESVIDECSHIDTKTIIFPSQLVFLNDVSYMSFVGYLMEYFNGCMLNEIDGSIDIDKILYELANIENDIRLLSSKKIIMDDTSWVNMLVNKNGDIRIIDTDFYHINNSLSCDSVLNTNNSLIYRSLVDSILSINIFLSTNEEIIKMKQQCYLGQISVTSFLTTIITLIKSKGLRVNNIDELRESYKLVLR